MKKYLIGTGLVLQLTLSLWGQQRASISEPTVRATADRIDLKVRFSNMQPGYYRLGIGTTGEPIKDLKIRLLRGGNALSKEVSSFRQGFTQTWFQVEEILVQGFRLVRADVPPPGQSLSLEVSLSRLEAEQLGRLFLIIARRYTLEHWYLEDGAEVNPSDW